MFEAVINENDTGKFGLSVRGHFAGEFNDQEGAFEKLQDLIGYELKALSGDSAEIKTLDEWFDKVSNSKAFMVNGMACHDFSFPSPDDDTDDSYSFYVYGPNGFLMEIFISSSDVKALKVVNEREIICDVTEGSYTFQALS